MKPSSSVPLVMITYKEAEEFRAVLTKGKSLAFDGVTPGAVSTLEDKEENFFFRFFFRFVFLRFFFFEFLVLRPFLLVFSAGPALRRTGPLGLSLDFPWTSLDFLVLSWPLLNSIGLPWTSVKSIEVY